MFFFLFNSGSLFRRYVQMLVSFDTAVTAQMWRLRGWNKFRQPFKVVKVVM